MSRRLVDGSVIRQRMDQKDARIAREQRHPGGEARRIHAAIDAEQRAFAADHADRARFHALLADPATGGKLDAILADFAQIDGEPQTGDAREELDGSTCSAACGFCGRCS